MGQVIAPISGERMRDRVVVGPKALALLDEALAEAGLQRE